VTFAKFSATPGKVAKMVAVYGTLATLRAQSGAKPLGCECPAGAALQVALECGGNMGIGEIMERQQPPRLELRAVRRLAGVVGGEPPLNVRAKPGVELARVFEALKDVDVVQAALLRLGLRRAAFVAADVENWLASRSRAATKAGGAEGNRTPDLCSAIA
jgi:hypothetical protein